MSENVHVLPVWKKNATAAERFYELAQQAERNPDAFGRYVVITEPKAGVAGNRCLYTSEMTLAYMIGLLELVKYDQIAAD